MFLYLKYLSVFKYFHISIFLPVKIVLFLLFQTITDSFCFTTPISLTLFDPYFFFSFFFSELFSLIPRTTYPPATDSYRHSESKPTAHMSEVICTLANFTIWLVVDWRFLRKFSTSSFIQFTTLATTVVKKSSSSRRCTLNPNTTCRIILAIK